MGDREPHRCRCVTQVEDESIRPIARQACWWP